jgi:hypothetical protein
VIPMPWFPDFAGAVELARQQTRAAGYLAATGSASSSGVW